MAGLAACLQCEAQEAVEASGIPAIGQPLVSIDNEVAILRVQLATALGVMPDSVTIEVQGTRIAGARVLLDPTQMRELVGQLTQPPER